MVSVQTETLFVYYDSEVDSGYSVDNLVPCTPEGLSGEQLYVPAGLDLNGEENEEADLGLYKIYRGVEIMISIEQMEPIRYLQEVKLSVLSSNRFNINSGEELRV